MRWFFKMPSPLTLLRRYRTRLVVMITIGWTLVDLLLWISRRTLPQPGSMRGQALLDDIQLSLIIHVCVVLVMSALMAWMLVFQFRKMFVKMGRLKNVLLKTLILIAFSFVLNFFNLFGYFYFVQEMKLVDALQYYWELPSEKYWLLNGIPIWLLIFSITQLLIEVNEKYSPGVFVDILMGKYIHPQEEYRIVLFVDLQDSTPIAEQLGHKLYFEFIRDFIYYVSLAIVENGGRIYQYVGDEIVTSWPVSNTNAAACIRSLLEARKLLQQAGTNFRRKYDIIPEFRAGIHAGNVMVGEIGVIKRDLAMSGDTMNTTARIRSACNDYNQRFMASKAFMDLTTLKDWQTNTLGTIELKGKSETVELYGLKI